MALATALKVLEPIAATQRSATGGGTARTMFDAPASVREIDRPIGLPLTTPRTHIADLTARRRPVLRYGPCESRALYPRAYCGTRARHRLPRPPELKTVLG
jgi:hypothetical protein